MQAKVFKDRLDWLTYRKTRGFGASEASALYGENEYLTAYELGRQKMAKEVKDEAASFQAQKGIDRESVARQKFTALHNIIEGTNLTFEPAFMELPDLPLFASLDGRSECGTMIIEIKSMSDPMAEDQRLPTKGQQRHLDVTSGKIPRGYFIQIQHALLVSGSKECWFISFDGESIKTCNILPDKTFMSNHLALCCNMWELIKRGIDLPPCEADYKSLRFAGAKKLADLCRLGNSAAIAEVKKLAAMDGRPWLKIDNLKVSEL